VGEVSNVIRSSDDGYRFTKCGEHSDRFEDHRCQAHSHRR
jgi:hypothetical protein